MIDPTQIAIIVAIIIIIIISFNLRRFEECVPKLPSF
jgi:hypothetical protein